MINSGYFFSSSEYYIDYVAGNNQIEGYISNAFLFLKNGILLRASKKSVQNNILFSRKDFNKEYFGEYKMNNDFIQVVFDKGKDWELRESYTIKENKLICLETNATGNLGKVYEFHEFDLNDSNE